ncbi:MAG: hypothetical protein BM564_13280 [Bacteroidetes bacterium MedPE-SWsnd-G2]|nr:MAG: hypothetical protein BM564_13280 [Bacteroidetes bacterium MedPE-SWsnd-G2]
MSNINKNKIIEYSTPKLLFSISINLLLLISIIIAQFVSSMDKPISFVFVSLFFSYFIYMNTSRLFTRKPALIINEIGLNLKPNKPHLSLIEWNNIESIYYIKRGRYSFIKKNIGINYTSENSKTLKHVTIRTKYLDCAYDKLYMLIHKTNNEYKNVKQETLELKEVQISTPPKNKPKFRF